MFLEKKWLDLMYIPEAFSNWCITHATLVLKLVGLL